VYYSEAHNCLIYKVDPRLRDLDGARRINGEYIAIPATLSNMQQVRRIPLPVVPPMELEGYDWPIRAPWRVLDHQRTTANFLVLNKRAFCFNDMGTMKTLSALWAADFLMEQENAEFRSLVVAPLSILKSVWGQHIFEHLGRRRKYAILHGSHEHRRRELAREVDFYIINPDGLCCGVPSDPRKALYGLAKDLLERDDIKLAIIDEAGAFRGATTRRSRAARVLLGNRSYLWQLTGTPTPNGPLDAYGLGKLAGATGGESFKSFKDRTMIHVSQWKWVPRASATEVVSQLLSPAIRFSSDFLNLPPCTAEQRDVPLSPEQTHAWSTLKKEAVLALRSGALVHAVNEAALRIKLIQVAAGVIYDGSHSSHELNASGRLAEVESIISETDRKVVIFAPLTNVLELLYRHLSKHERVILNGATPHRDRADILRAFGSRDSGPRICLADPSATAHGVNDFVSAGVCVWYAPTDKNELYRQGVKRLDRPGQTGPVKIVQLVSTKLEKEIYQRLDRNESMQGLVLKWAEEK
jgi:SNF2 family DNA or RNA helicase